MKRSKTNHIGLALFAIILVKAAPDEGARAQESAQGEYVRADSKWVKLLEKMDVGTLWYLGYAAGEQDGQPYNRAYVGRGYLTLKFKPVDWFEPRITLDTTQDDSGDFKVRLKYLYGRFVLPVETAVITEPELEVGLVHGPWFDYEEHINWYRMQGTMFIERNKVLNSADAGFTAAALLGGKLDLEYRDRVSSKYPGRWGSLALGVYNGGGYHAAEKNQNKVFASRLSVRPLGGLLPNLQLSHFFIHGKGNTTEEPDWRLNALMLSFEHQYFVATAQVAAGRGNQKGDKVDAAGAALESLGYSGFLELKLPWVRSSAIGRYDYWEWGQTASTRIVAGLAYHFLKNNFILLNLDRVSHDDPAAPGRPVDMQVGVILQVKYPPK